MLQNKYFQPFQSGKGFPLLRASNLRDPPTNSTWWLYHIAYGGEVSLKQFKLQVLLHFHYMLLGIALPSLESIYTDCVCVRPLPLNYYHLHITITPPPFTKNRSKLSFLSQAIKPLKAEESVCILFALF